MIQPGSSAPEAGETHIRPATSSDQQKIADLIFFESHVHRHLDWRTPLDWLGSSPYWVAQEGRRISAALAFPTDPDSIAWIRLFAFASHLSWRSAWPPLWAAARNQLAEQGGGTVAAIATQNWFNQVLVEESFDLADYIVMLEWSDAATEQRQPPAEFRIREMKLEDLARVVEIDNTAFEPLWRNSSAALSKAFQQSSYGSLAEHGTEIVGYQLSSGGTFGAHLARLAVLPQWQSRGIGAALVSDLIEHMKRGGGSRITVNTQASNVASLALYERLGFEPTGDRFPVYTMQVP